MAPRNPEKLAKKSDYLNKFIDLLETTPRVLIIEADFVGSRQFQEVRIALRGKATVVMGKNTMIRTALRQFALKHEDIDVTPLIEAIRGNIGFVFCDAPMDEVREIVLSNTVPAAAKAGIISSVDVVIPAGPTSMDPSQTSFFQALNIATKIVKGQIEIVNEVHLIKLGNKVQMSEQVLLQKLNIKPFEFGLKISHIYEDGNLFDAAVLELTNEAILSKFFDGVANVAAFSREVGMPNEVSISHSVSDAFKNVAALCSDIEYSFKEIESVKEFLADPSKFAAAAPAAAAAGGASAAPVAAAVEEEEEEEDDMGFALFD